MCLVVPGLSVKVFGMSRDRISGLVRVEIVDESEEYTTDFGLREALTHIEQTMLSDSDGKMRIKFTIVTNDNPE